jgi:hypothetical protein
MKPQHTYIIAYMLRDDDNHGILTEHYEVFQPGDQSDPEAEAAIRYELLLTANEVYSASLAQVLRSTDYVITAVPEPLTVHVVTWVLFHGGEASSGGFDWYYTAKDASDAFYRTRDEFGHDQPMNMRQVAVPVPGITGNPHTPEGQHQITEYLIANSDLYEYATDPRGIKGIALPATRIHFRAEDPS